MFLVVSCSIDRMAGSDWKRVQELVIRRRTELGMKTSTALAAKAKLTARLIGDLENARRSNYGPGTIAQIESALKWAPGSITSILGGGDPTPQLEADDQYRLILDLDSTISRLRDELEATHPEDDNSRIMLLDELHRTQTVRHALRGIEERRFDDEERSVWLQLSFLADEVDAASSIMSPNPDDNTRDIETYIDEVDNLVTAAEELTDAVHKAVLDAFSGDVARLRQAKREVRRANLARQGMRQPDIFEEGANATRQADYGLARRTAPPGYTPGQSAQGEAGGEESQET